MKKMFFKVISSGKWRMPKANSNLRQNSKFFWILFVLNFCFRFKFAPGKLHFLLFITLKNILYIKHFFFFLTTIALCLLLSEMCCFHNLKDLCFLTRHTSLFYLLLKLLYIFKCTAALYLENVLVYPWRYFWLCRGLSNINKNS